MHSYNIVLKFEISWFDNFKLMFKKVIKLKKNIKW